MTSLVTSLLAMYHTPLPHQYLKMLDPYLVYSLPHPTQWGCHEYLTPKEGSDTSKDSIYAPDSGVTVGSLPDNYHPAVTACSDLTGDAGYQNSVCGYNYHNSHLLNINNIYKDNQKTETNEAEILENTITMDKDTQDLGRISTESGYNTIRSSMESTEEKVLCKYGPEHDEVFYNEEGEEEQLIHDDNLE